MNATSAVDGRSDRWRTNGEEVPLDGQQIQRFLQVLGQALTRRRALAGLAGLVALGGAPRVSAEEATPAAGGRRCPSPLATPTASLAASPVATPTGKPVCVGVLAEEFSFRPDRTTFQVGQPYIFAVGNAGHEVHEFVIEAAGTLDAPLEVEVDGEEHEAELEDIAPGQTAELQWTFTEPGDYQFACHIPGHYEEGMVITIAVVA
jgi:uncharacterized cupredoxin-like copper-binding protein